MNNEFLKLKAIMLSKDGGKTWIVIRQFYLSHPETRELLSKNLEGRELTMKEEQTNDPRQLNEKP